MKLDKSRIGLLAAVLCAVCNGAAGQKILEYEDIVKRLYTFDHLAEFPAEGERSGNITSFNRDAKYNEQTGSYENWHANKDGDGYLRREGSDIVAAEMEGPGVIWRIWSAKPREGHIKIFIDDHAEPVLDMPFQEFFNASSDHFPYPALVHIIARGFNYYVPITFQKSCKITFGKGWGRFFQFTYSTFPEGTIVPSFRGSFNEVDKAVLKRANMILSNTGKALMKKSKGTKVEKNISVPPGETVEVWMLEGARAITSLHVKPQIGEDDDPVAFLRELAISITWDNEPSPSVWSPLGDFFGSAPGINEYASFPMGMADEGFYSNWYMPFAESASIKLTNDGKKQRNVEFQVVHTPLKKPADQLLRFHAKWHRDAYPWVDRERYLRGDRWPDWPLLIARGKGRFCGVCLTNWNPNPKGVIRKEIPREELRSVPEGIIPDLNRICRRYWWGEGDEKFFVDGEKFPSTFGTGTEDYFGYAWCTPEYFESSFQNQTLNERNRGHISVNRFQIADNVPFTSSFEGCLEKYHPNEWPLLYCCVVYWYQNARGSDPYGPVDIGKRVDYYAVPK
jgi:hypothetical protein